MNAMDRELARVIPTQESIRDRIKKLETNRNQINKLLEDTEDLAEKILDEIDNKVRILQEQCPHNEVEDGMFFSTCAICGYTDY